MAKLAASTYGEALFELAVESGKTKEYLDEAKAMLAAFADNKELSELLNHPKVDKEEKIRAMESIFGSFLSKDMVGFLVLAVKKGRQTEIEAILTYFISKVKEYEKVGVVYVATPMEMTEAQKAKTQERILATTSYETLEMNYEVDPSLIGGMVIRIGDRVVDTSIKAKLNDLSKNLTGIQLA